LCGKDFWFPYSQSPIPFNFQAMAAPISAYLER
jgi:hypothetical protein